MFLKILGGVAAVGLIFLAYVAFVKSPDFKISREISIKAPAEAIFPHINEMKAFIKWNPWLKLAPDAKITFEGPESGVGASYSWDGDMNVGAGKMTVTDSTPNSRVVSKLEFLRPFPGVNQTVFTIEPRGGQNALTWTMTGTSTFLPKLMGTLFNMDKMMGDTFDQGLRDLKATLEAGAPVVETK